MPVRESPLPRCRTVCTGPPETSESSIQVGGCLIVVADLFLSKDQWRLCNPHAAAVACLGNAYRNQQPMRAAYVRAAYVLIAINRFIPIDRQLMVDGGVVRVAGPRCAFITMPAAAAGTQFPQPEATEHHERVRAYEIAAYVASCHCPSAPLTPRPPGTSQQRLFPSTSLRAHRSTLSPATT